MQAISNSIGMAEDELRILFCVLIQIPISMSFRYLPTTTKTDQMTRKIYAALVAVFSNLFCFDFYGNLVFLISAIISYQLSLRCVTKTQTLYMSFISFSFLCIANIIRLYVDYKGNSNNVSLLFMILTPRMIYFNWTVFRQINKKEYANIPSLVDYLFYIYNYIGGITGPVLTYEEHDAFICQSYPEEKINWKIIGATFFEAVVYVIIYFFSMSYYDYHLVEKPAFNNLNLLFQVGIIVLEGILMRVRFMVVWRLEYIQIVSANLRCSESKFEEYVQTVNFAQVELQNSTKVRIDNWNMSIQKWLKNCFYIPSKEVLKLSNNHASLFTFIISAFWHGFYPTYYVSFFGANLVSEAEKLVYKCPALFKYFPSFYFRFMLDLQGLLFKRFTWKQWYPTLFNFRYFFGLNIIVFGLLTVLCPIINKKYKNENKQKQSKETENSKKIK